MPITDAAEPAPNTPEPDAVLTTAEVADRFGVSRATVLRWVSDGRLPSKRLGPKTFRYLRSDVDAFEAAS